MKDQNDSKEVAGESEDGASSREPKQRPGQPGGRRDRNRKERLKSLSQSALELFLEHGIQVTTIDEITKAAGVAKGSFYRYFDDKCAVVEFLFEDMHQTAERLLKKCAEDLEQAGDDFDGMNEAYSTMGLTLGMYLLSNRDIVQLYLQESRCPAHGPTQPVRAIADLISKQAIEITRQAHKQQLLRPFPAEVSALLVVGACEKLLCAQLEGMDLGEPLELVQAITSLVLDGLRARTD